MVQKLSEIIGRKVSILVDGGAKGITKIKGSVTDVNDDDGIITILTEGGMMGGKEHEVLFSMYSIIGIELEK